MYLARMPRRLRSSSAAANASMRRPSPSSGMPTALTPSRASRLSEPPIALLLDEDGVAARQQHAVDQVDGLQRARRDQDFVGRAGNPGVPLELGGQELAQRAVAERSAFETVGRERRALAREHGGDGRDQAIDRNVLRVVVAADEVVLGEARPFGRRRRQSGRQHRCEVERPGGHGCGLLSADCGRLTQTRCADLDARLNGREGPGMSRSLCLEIAFWRSETMDVRDLHDKGLKLRQEMFGAAAVEQRMNAFGAFGEPLQNIINAYAYGDVWSRTALPMANEIARHGGDDGGGRPRERASRPPQGRARQRLHGRADPGDSSAGRDLLRDSGRPTRRIASRSTSWANAAPG